MHAVMSKLAGGGLTKEQEKEQILKKANWKTPVNCQFWAHIN